MTSKCRGLREASPLPACASITLNLPRQAMASAPAAALPGTANAPAAVVSSAYRSSPRTPPKGRATSPPSVKAGGGWRWRPFASLGRGIALGAGGGGAAAWVSSCLSPCAWCRPHHSANSAAARFIDALQVLGGGSVAHASPLWPLRLPGGSRQHAGQRRRVLILMSDTGGGHRASADALRAGFQQLYGDQYAIEVVDLWTHHTPWPFNQLPKSYSFMVRYPFIWRANFTATQPRLVHVPLATATAAVVGRHVSAAYDKYRPNLVLSVHPLMQHVPVRVLRQRIKAGLQDARTAFATVVTDLTTCHNTWFYPGVDRCYVATEESRHQALRMGLQVGVHLCWCTCVFLLVWLSDQVPNITCVFHSACRRINCECTGCPSALLLHASFLPSTACVAPWAWRWTPPQCCLWEGARGWARWRPLWRLWPPLLGRSARWWCAAGMHGWWSDSTRREL